MTRRNKEGEAGGGDCCAMPRDFLSINFRDHKADVERTIASVHA